MIDIVGQSKFIYMLLGTNHVPWIAFIQYNLETKAYIAMVLLATWSVFFVTWSMLELKKIYSLNYYSWMRTRKRMEVYNTRFPGLELHVMSWRKRTSLSGESTYVYSLYTIHKELLVLKLKIQFIHYQVRAEVEGEQGDEPPGPAEQCGTDPGTEAERSRRPQVRGNWHW